MDTRGKLGKEGKVQGMDTVVAVENYIAVAVGGHTVETFGDDHLNEGWLRLPHSYNTFPNFQ